MLDNKPSKLKFKSADILMPWEGELESVGVGVYVCVCDGGGEWLNNRGEPGCNTNNNLYQYTLCVRDLMYVTSFNVHNKSEGHAIISTFKDEEAEGLLWWRSG